MTINRNNYEEYFLLYVDRELGDGERQMVEDFVLRHPDLEKELTALKQTISVPTETVFENKEALLRQERERRLFPVYLWRIAAALLIVLAGAWFLMMTGKTRKPVQPSADSREIAIKKDAKHEKLAAERKTEKTESSVSGKKTDADSLRPGHLRKTGIPVIRQQPGSGLLSQDSNPKQQKLNTGKQNGRNPAEKTNPDPANDFPETAASEKQLNPQPATDLPNLEQNKILPATTKWSSIPSDGQRAPLSAINHQPSTIDRQPSTTQSILVFDNENKTVSGFFKKLLSGPPEDAMADNHRKKVRVSVFQFNLKK